MRTSEEIYHQVRWDPRFDPARFVLGLLQRGAPPKRIPLPAFVPGGEIPWHRVLFVEADGELVWDRASGLDRVGVSEAGRVREPRRLRAPFFAARTPCAWAGDAWRPVDGGTGPAAAPVRTGVRVLTWNTLWDRYDAELIGTELRRPRLLAALAEADADVIALQEVEPALLVRLLAADWVRAGYTLSADPAGRDVAEYGLVVLSRLPVREAGVQVLGPHKAVSAAVLDTGAGSLTVAATHLTSDHSERGPERREEELARLAEALASVPDDVVLLGDFNDGRAGDAGPAAALGLRDVWEETYGPGDTTPTFDPGANPLAAVSSLSGRASRLDRILLRGAARVTGAGLLGDAPGPDGLFVSDHYGVRAELSFGAGESAGAAAVPDVLDTPPAVRTALAWLPPRELWPVVQGLRLAHDPAVRRWPPHVNLLFGFVPEHEFERAAGLVAEVVADTPSFPVRLAGVDTFGHREDATVWLDPAADGDAPWQELRAALVARFPRCRGRAGGFTPHLTLGRTGDPQRVAAACAEALADAPSTARVGELALLSRRGDEPMRVRATVALGTGEVRWLPESGEEVPGGAGGDAGEAGTVTAPTVASGVVAAEAVVSEAVQVDAGADASDARAPGAGSAGAGSAGAGSAGAGSAGAGSAVLPAEAPSADAPAPGSGEAAALSVARVLDDAVVRVVGSRRMGCALPGADLDLVAVLPGAADAAAVAARLAAALPGVTRLREVRGARVPGLRFALGGLDVDLVVVGAGPLPPAAAVDRRAELGEAAAVALSAVSDADAVRAAVGTRAPAFEVLARRVKAWARARGLDSAPHGGLPGLAWTVLAARTVLDAAEGAEGDALLREFFATWAAWDWHAPVSLTAPHDASAPQPPEAPDAVTVLTPSAPVRSCTTQVSPGFRDLLVQELYQAWEALEAGDAAAWTGPPPLHRRHAAWAVVTVRAHGDAEFEELLGRVRGRTRALLTALEEAGAPDAHAWPRPYRTGSRTARFAIGLGHTPPDATTLTAVARAWSHDLRGVELTHVEGGALPTLT
ncbi:poly(A) polymerase [Streptomyces sp. NPDC101118]|uniref:poly(A) polymerase n=1 Tax=Streptomyces sp. NPDC101118 TaxID=3366109 RepID=UPI0037F121C4